QSMFYVGARTIEELKSRGFTHLENLKISDRAHVIMPWHFAEDRVLDKSTGGEDIGTTGRGIGPCYRDKVGRSFAIRMGDLYRGAFPERVRHIAAAKNGWLSTEDQIDPEAVIQQYATFAKTLESHVCDTTEMLLTAAEDGKQILFEGAQGSLLDVDHGTYPYVTSSNSSGVGVSNGSGVPAKFITDTIGIVKAYSTRVGGGPFPTEQDNEFGQHLRERGNEYGTVTRRPRRCGWLDAVALRYTSRLSGVDGVCVMLMDVLSGLEEIKVCTAYELDGKASDRYPSHVDDLRRVKPVYESLPGWSEDISACREMSELPDNALRYLDRVSELVGAPVRYVSVGPGREQTIAAHATAGA
ncbi:MAG: adenylosuccinate synthase, partial [Planctomycetales bacterium]|nr:adenylosuccinate synthase [Planctomycetales bacterium]